jgi:hypothetical protein
MLTHCQFNSLDHADRIQILEDFGTYLELSRQSEGCKVALFDLYGFYVEVYLDQQEDRIIKLHGFGNTNRLEKYLRQIDISSMCLEL